MGRCNCVPPTGSVRNCGNAYSQLQGKTCDCGGKREELCFVSRKCCDWINDPITLRAGEKITFVAHRPPNTVTCSRRSVSDFIHAGCMDDEKQIRWAGSAYNDLL